MSITVQIGLLSGKTVSMKADLKEEVGRMNRRAQTALGVGRGRLVDSLDTFWMNLHRSSMRGCRMVMQ